MQSVTRSGGVVIAQDEASSAVHTVLPLAEIARELKRLAKIPELTEA